MEKQRIKIIDNILGVLTFSFLILVTSLANSQVIPGEELPPPSPHQMVDSYGMELVGGTAKIPGVSVNIGTQTSGMSFSESGWNSGNHDYQGRIILENTLDYAFPQIPIDSEPAGHYVIVSTGSINAKFKKVSTANEIVGPFTLYKGKGSLTMPTATTFLYIGEDGSEYSFDMAYSGQYDSLNFPINKRAVAALTRIRKSDNEIVNVNYKYIGPINLGFGVLQLHRFDSAVSSLGWMIKYNADRDIFPQHDKSVVALNSSVDYCSSTPGVCPNLTRTWPISSIEHQLSKTENIYMTLDYQVSYSGTLTDAGGYQSTLVYSYYFPTSTYDVLYTTPGGVQKTYTKFLCHASEVNQTNVGTCRNSVSGNVKRYVKLSIGEHEFNYNNYLTAGNSGVYGGEYIPKAYRSTGPAEDVDYRGTYPENPASRIDKLGRQQTYRWEDGLINSIENIGDTTHVDYEYDSRGNIEFIRQYPRNDMGDPIVTSATYPTCANSTTVKNCSKPLTITKPDGVTTTYTYSAVHGGVLTATAAAVNGIQAQTRYRYEQKRAKIKDSGGNLVDSTPVWRLVETSSCRTQTLDTCVGTADERRVLIYYDVDSGVSVAANETANVLPVREIVKLGDGTIQLVTDTAYDIYGNVKSVDGPKPGTYDKVYYFYDALRRKIAEIGVDPDGSGPNPRQATRTYYNGDNQVTSIRKGVVTGTTLSAVNAMVVDQKIDTEYDPAIGLPIVERSYANGVLRNVVQKSYDSMLRLDCVAQRLNPAYFNSLPASTCALGVAGPEGNDRITRNEYDAAGALVKIYQAYGTPRERVYKTNNYRTDNGLLESVEDALGNTTFYGYDEYNRQDRITYPHKTNGAVPSTTDYTETVFDGAVISSVRLRDGQMVYFPEYDERGRVKTKTGAVQETFTYDNFNNVITHGSTTPGYQSTTNSTTFGFNALGWKTSEKSGTETVSYLYNDFGQRIRLTWPDTFYVTYDYNVNGYQSDQLQNIKEYNSAVLASYMYDAYGRRDLLVRGNGVVTDYEYDDLSRLDLLETDISGTTYDISESFGYTVAGQLKTRTADTPFNGYVYQPSIGTVNYGAANALNQLTTVNGTSVTYDNRGNMTLESGITYAYNANNLLTSATGLGNTSTLTYDAENRLSRLVQNGTITDFRYDGEDLIAEKNSSGAITARYVHGPSIDDPIVWYVGSGTATKRYFGENYQGSVINITDNNGNIYATNAYDEYGNPSPTNSGRFQYTGQTWLGSQVGLYYYKARVYNPKIGRFMQTDPIGYEDQMNLYGYVRGDPLNLVDSNGEDSSPADWNWESQQEKSRSLEGQRETFSVEMGPLSREAADRINTDTSHGMGLVAEVAGIAVTLAARGQDRGLGSAVGAAVGHLLTENNEFTVHEGDTILVETTVEFTSDTDSGYKVVGQTQTVTNKNGEVQIKLETVKEYK